MASSEYGDFCKNDPYSPIKLINQVKLHPALYDGTQIIDREGRLHLWKEVASAIYPDWGECSKAESYDRVLQLQRKWRSLRDAYNRELRFRRTGTRTLRRVYRYFKHMSFLGGFEGYENAGPSEEEEQRSTDDPLVQDRKLKRKYTRKTKQERQSIEADENNIDGELPMFHLSSFEDNEDSDKLFLMSFAPEMRHLPLHIKMWARAQIAGVMQEAVDCHYNNTTPRSNIFKHVEEPSIPGEMPN